MFIETSVCHADGSTDPIVLDVDERPSGLVIAGASRVFQLPPGSGVHFHFRSKRFGINTCAVAVNPICADCGQIHP